MGVITGKAGQISGNDADPIERFMDFSATAEVDLKEIMDAGTGGSRRRIPGTQGWNATYNSGGIKPTYLAGAIIDFLGSIDGAVGISGQALITQTAITIPVSTNDPITYENTLYGLDVLAAGAAVVAEPDPPLAPVMPKGICVELSPCDLDAVAYAAEENTTNIVITLTVDAAEYVDCSTNGARAAIEGPWDASVDYDRNADDFSLLPDREKAFYCRVPTEENSVATEWYEFQFMRPGEWSNMQVNRNGDFVSASVPLAYSRVEEVGATTPTETKGQVLLPGGAVWRPEPAVVVFARRFTQIQLAIDTATIARDTATEQAMQDAMQRRITFHQGRWDELFAAVERFNDRQSDPVKMIPLPTQTPVLDVEV